MDGHFVYKILHLVFILNLRINSIMDNNDDNYCGISTDESERDSIMT